ncbi:MAG: hypothetical protein LLG01_01035 [Planctomycetaceae bacterium]|nr:hypothetical protein [Planctomycetaceae bacterium]
MHRVVLAMVTMAMLGGCTSTPRFSRQRYDTLYTGMPDFEVRNILGNPKVEGGAAWEYEHFNPYYKAIIHFRNGAVARREWMNDPPQAKVPASAPATQPPEQPQNDPPPPDPATAPDAP